VENVELPLLVSGVRLREARKRALEALEQVGLAERANHRPAELSGGERQRTTIARALVNRPALVWADEPTGDLDSETASEIMDVLVDLNQEQQLTFILVTHARSVGARCGRIVRMRDGLIEDQQPGREQES
jgi:putative ABC transport system ATP-binding protein